MRYTLRVTESATRETQDYPVIIGGPITIKKAMDALRQALDTDISPDTDDERMILPRNFIYANLRRNILTVESKEVYFGKMTWDVEIIPGRAYT